MKIDVPIEELRKRKLFIGTPMYGGVNHGMFCKGIADLSAMCQHYGVQLHLDFLFNESLITRARNYVCDDFMRSDATHLMFIDADIGFNPQDVLALLALSSDESPYDIIGAPYAKKCIAWEKVAAAVNKGFADKDPANLANFIGDFVFNPKAGMTQIPLGEPSEVMEIGTGFMMIRKDSMKKFEAAYPQYKYRPDHARTQNFDGSRLITMYFQAEQDMFNPVELFRKTLSDIADGAGSDLAASKALEEAADLMAKSTNRYLSEDYWFCQKMQAIGVKTWLCPWMKLHHCGNYIFGSSLQDLAAIGATATVDPSQLKKEKK